MRQLTDQQVADLLAWKKKVEGTNWGSWMESDYPLTGCTYDSFDDCPIRIKFDEDVEYKEEVFRLIGSTRRIPGKGDSITFSHLRSLNMSDEEKAVEREEYWKKDFENAQIWKSKRMAYENQSDEVKKIIADVEKEISEILGTPCSKSNRKELQHKLDGYALPIQDSDWCEKACLFSTVEEYISFKKSQS